MIQPTVRDTFQVIDLFDSLPSDRSQLDWRSALWNKLDTPIFLVLLGALSAFVAFGVMTTVEWVFYARDCAIDHWDPAGGWALVGTLLAPPLDAAELCCSQAVGLTEMRARRRGDPSQAPP